MVFEPTGPYHRAFERALAEAGVAARQGQPAPGPPLRRGDRQARQDRSPRRRAARPHGRVLELEARPARSEILDDLKELHIAREALVKDRTAAKNRAKVLTLAAVSKRQNAERLEADRSARSPPSRRQIRARIEADPDLARRFADPDEHPGRLADHGLRACSIEMPELGTLEAGQAASLAGLAPVARQSGRWTGRAFIRGGRASLRQALYMPALVAARFNPDLKAKYDSADQSRKARKGRHHRHHAKAHRARQRPPQRREPGHQN